MAYKVLGQTSSTSVTTSAVVTNLIKDPSFTIGSAFTTAVTGTTNQTNAIVNVSSPWRWAINSSYGRLISPTVHNETTAPFGATHSALGFFRSGGSSEGFLTQGVRDSINPVDSIAFDEVNQATVIPVEGSTTYYAGFSYWLNNTSYIQNSPYMKIHWLSTTGIIGTETISMSNYSTNTWARTSGTTTSPSTAIAIAVNLYCNLSNNGKDLFDGIVFGKVSSYASTFTEPLTPSVAVTTAPFDKKIDGYLSENVLTANSGLTYAGPISTLYTVPAGSSAVVSTVSVANLTGVSNTYRIAVVPSGETLAKKHFTHMDIPIAANNTQTITIGMTLSAGDTIRVAADTDKVSFTAFGSEA